MIANGISPLDAGPPLDLATLGAQLVALRSGGLPVARAADRHRRAGRARDRGGASSYGRDGDWTMVAISIAILAVIVVGVVTAIAVTV